MTDKVNVAIFGMFWCFITVLFFTASVVFGQDVTSTTLPVIASNPGLDQAQHVIDQLGTGWTLMIATLIIEMLLRTFKTTNPKSLLYMISSVLRMVAKVAEFIAQAADKVLQRTKE